MYVQLLLQNITVSLNTISKLQWVICSLNREKLFLNQAIMKGWLVLSSAEVISKLFLYAFPQENLNNYILSD